MERIQAGLDKADARTERDTANPGVWTIIFGALLVIAALGFVFRVTTAAAAIIASLVGVGTTVATIVFFASPIGALAEDSPKRDLDESRGYGLWAVFLISVAALIVALVGVLLLLRKSRSATIFNSMPMGYPQGSGPGMPHPPGGMPSGPRPSGPTPPVPPWPNPPDHGRHNGPTW